MSFFTINAFYRVIVSFLLFVFSFARTLQEGFGVETLVKTTAGYQAIGECHSKQSIISFDTKNNTQQPSTIVGIRRLLLDQYIEITLYDNIVIKTGSDQRFYVNGTWVTAQQLLTSPALHTAFPAPVKAIRHVTGDPHSFVQLTLYKNHTFFITNHDLLVHNIVVLDVGILFEVGVKIVQSLEFIVHGPGFYAAAGSAIGWLSYKIGKNRNKEKPEKTPKAPGVPTEKEGYVAPKGWNGRKVPHPRSGQYGYPDDQGRIWVPTGEGGMAHGGPHWDIIGPNGKKEKNVYPGGKVR